MMIKREFAFASADGKTILHVIMWVPEAVPKGIVQIAHGVSEYAGRYEDVAEVLTDAGYVVVCHDQLGHGKSINTAKDKMYFGDWEHLVSDFEVVAEVVRKEIADMPYFVMGFSMGSFLVREYLIKHSHEVSGAIIMGTGYQPKAITKIMRMIVNAEAKKIGENNTSEFIEKLSDGVDNSNIKNPVSKRSWLLANDESLLEYMNDPNVGGAMTAGLFREMLYGMEVTCDKKNVRMMDRTLPVLLMSGSEDPVGNMIKGVYAVEKMFKNAGMQDVEVLFYPESRHDILHELVREKVLHDWSTWMDKQVAKETNGAA